MRVMVFVKATKDSEAGLMPEPGMFEAMGKYNQELIDAGIMQMGDGLKPSSAGKRIALDGAKRDVIDGPFAAASFCAYAAGANIAATPAATIQCLRRCIDMKFTSGPTP